MGGKESHVFAGKQRQPSNLQTISAVTKLKCAESGLKTFFLP
jgi:hypothetical protein